MCGKESNIFPPRKPMIYYCINQTTHLIKCKIRRFVFGEIRPPKSNIDTKNDVVFQCISFQIWGHVGYLPWAPKTMKNQGVGHLTNQVIYITPTLWGLDWSPSQNHFWNDCGVVWPTHPLNSFFQHRLPIPWNHFSNHWPPLRNHFSRSSGTSKSFLRNDFVCHELLPQK